MKWSLVLVAVSLLAIASAQTGKQCSDEVSSQCPPPGVGTEPVFFPKDDDCSQYCLCSNGAAWLFNCPPGTLWDAAINECLAQYEVNCGSRPIP